MQEPMNSTTHRWSHSWYRSKHCPLSIVQDGGDTAINGTVLIYFQTSPDLCHQVGRGINPHSGAVTVLSYYTCAVDFNLMPRQFTPKPFYLVDNFTHRLNQQSLYTQRIILRAFGLGLSQS